MRDIRFRAWDGKEMHWGYDNNGYDVRRIADDSFDEDLFDNSDVVWMQFTGLHDRNGKEIWEGDVLADVGGNGAYYKVEWHEDRFITIHVHNGDIGPSLRVRADEHEVIGNIYENPELLNAPSASS